MIAFGVLFISIFVIPITFMAIKKSTLDYSEFSNLNLDVKSLGPNFRTETNDVPISQDNKIHDHKIESEEVKWEMEKIKMQEKRYEEDMLEYERDMELHMADMDLYNKYHEEFEDEIPT